MAREASDAEILEILRHNQGFVDPAQWIDFARKNCFAKVAARQILFCPDCGCEDSVEIGQYVYYSQLIKLKRCSRCDLRFSDISIDRSVIKQHFEYSYKDVAYFENERRPILEHVADQICGRLPPGTTIMDAGGGLGHLARIIRAKNRSYDVLVSDISRRACDYAAKEHDLTVVCCAIEQLGRSHLSFDALLLIDVLYYTDNIREAWQSISHAIKPGGYVVIRFPNRLWRTDIVQLLRRLLPYRHPETSVHGINCEHVYFFCRKYMKRRLVDLGFRDVMFCPSPTRITGRKAIDWIGRLLFAFSRGISTFSFGRIIVTPAQLVVARKSPPLE